MQAESQPQSWAAWFLDGYTNTVVASTQDEHDESIFESASSTTSDDRAMNLYNYAKTGRGGFGNFQWGAAQPADAEAQKPQTIVEQRNDAVKIEHMDTSTAVRNSQAKNSTFFIKAGRGGAGNVAYVQSNEIQTSPTSANFSKSTMAPSKPIYTGRGGAGNYYATQAISESAKLAKEQEAKVEAEKRRAQAEQQVQDMIQPPTQAYLGSRRRSMSAEEVDPNMV